ncbi:DDE-type integrase/transposase/recombinase [Aureimonas leprariae]|uniref:DDE-type integrase/transposase/recombinase n=1 Tax=Plantimonas leprariae TaxID=2615207 RepID=UPI0013871535|nr:DDE-type integrase/transposase/recombinase [Aureimonas leprariae]
MTRLDDFQPIDLEDKEGLFIPPGARNVVGKNIVARAIRARDQYDLAVKRLGKREADKLFSTVAAGPDGRYPLHEVEIDHTTLDMIVVHENGAILGRPYLTVLIDRHTRMILGFAIGFTPPSWTSVMEALAMAVLPKDDFLARMRGSELSIVSDWPCFGPPDVLFVDRGAEFRSASMRAAEMALNMRIVDLPPGSPWLKGKIERWFRTLNLKLLHR